jgi:S1-C subfamily serine protease/phage FluMu protein Com
MDVRCRCAACNTQFKIDAKFAGRKAKCPKCATVVMVPSVSADEAASQSAVDQVATFPAVVEPKPAVAEPATEIPTFPAVVQANPAAAAPPRRPKPSDSVVAGGSSILSGIETAGAVATGIPSFDVTASQSSISGRSSVATKRNASRKPIPKLWWIVGGAGTAAVLLIAIIVVAVSSMRGALSGPTTLVFNWPTSERTGASLLIDGETIKVPASGEMAFELKPGEHRVLLRRRGYEQIEVLVSLGNGERRPFKPEWKENALASNSFSGSNFQGGTNNNTSVFSTPSGNQGWLQNFDEAKGAAAQQKKDILIAFTGTGWSQGSRKLQDEVFFSGDFRSLAQSQFVLVKIDLPKTEEGYNQLEDASHNAWMRKQFSVRTIPTIVICDPQGLPYAFEERYSSSADQYVKRLKELVDSKQERDRILEQAKTAAGDARLTAALEAVKWLQERKVLQFYGTTVRQWTALGQQFDPQNEKGQFEVLFEADWLVRLLDAREKLPQQIPTIAAELGQWKQGKKFHDDNRAARLHLIAAAILMESENRELAATYIDEGLAYNPTDQSLRDELKSASSFLNGELGSGTGFAVADGYILTNHHVIEGPGKVTVRLPGTTDKIPAEVVARNSQRDMALLRVKLPGGVTLNPLPISTAEVRRGASVAAFGYPLGDDFGAGLKLTTGVVSGLPAQSDEKMMLLDCRINPGNSGGPLCDTRGSVIGMVTAKSVGGIGVDSYGMALPAEDLFDFVKQNVPGFQPPPAAGQDVLGWDEVDQRVSPSVLTVFKYER